MKNSPKFSERLSELIFEEQITNKLLANAINVNVTTIQRWRRDCTKIYLSNLVALCNYFNCSIDFIVGRIDKKLDFVPHECPPFYNQIRKIMQEKSITRYRMTKESKFKESYFHGWKNGSEPQLPTLIELADYFDVTIDYLICRER